LRTCIHMALVVFVPFLRHHQRCVRENVFTLLPPFL
jgi:hypothetical protein